MQEYEKSLLSLIVTGALIGVAKLLISSESLTFRVIAGRAILGSAASLIAGIVLLQFPKISPLALVGLGSAFGIIGQQYLEKFLREKVSNWLEKGKKDERE